MSVAALAVVAALMVGACSSGASHARGPAFPGTAAGKQARWLFGAATRTPIPTPEIDAHFDTTFLSVTTQADLNAGLAGTTTPRLDSIAASTPSAINFVVTSNGRQVAVRLAVDGRGLISALHLGPVGTPTTAPAAGPTPPGARAISVGVGSPPLTATLTLPAGARGNVPAIVLVGGSGPSDQDETVGPDKPFRDLADGLAADGIATLRYDKRSRDYPATINEATFTPTQEYVPDAVAAINLLRSRPEIDPSHIFLLGHSQGGTLAPLIAETDPQVAGVILLAASAEPLGAALVRQFTYLSTLPGAIGAQAAAQLPAARQAKAQIDNPDLATESPAKRLSPLLGGAGPGYFLDLRRYDEVATAGARPQPLLFLQGDRDYQVTVADDLHVWLKGLAGRGHVTVRQYPHADHLFIDGTGPPSPADYATPRHVDPAVIADIAAWVSTMK